MTPKGKSALAIERKGKVVFLHLVARAKKQSHRNELNLQDSPSPHHPHESVFIHFQ